MENIRCYGKNPNPPKKEKSFIRKFFEGNESSESSLFGESSADVLQEDSLEENKENNRESFYKSPTLFGSINLSPEKETLKKSEIKKGTKTNRLYVRKKIIKIVKKKPKRVFPKSTKHYASLQPRWSEFYKHDLTIEKQGNNKTRSVLSSRYQNCNKIRRHKKYATSVNSPQKKKFHKEKDRSFISSSDCLSASDSSCYSITEVVGKFSSNLNVSDVDSEKCTEIINRSKTSGKSLTACNLEQDLKKKDSIFIPSSDSLSASDSSKNSITEVVGKFSSNFNVSDVDSEKCTEIINRSKTSGKSLTACNLEQDLKKKDSIFIPSSDSLSTSDSSKNSITEVGGKFSSNFDVSDVHGEKCTEIINRSKTSGKSVIACNLEQDLNSTFPSTNVIQELSKRFDENVKLEEFSVASDLHNAENLCPKSPLNCKKSSISLTKFSDSHESRNLNASGNLSHVLKSHSDNTSVKSISYSSNSINQLNPTSLIHSLEKTPVQKFMTSTPKIPKSIYVHHPVKDSYKSYRSALSTSKASCSIFPPPTIITDDLNFNVKNIDCSESYPKNTAPDKERMSSSSLLEGPKSLLSNILCNKSMTLPSRKESVSSVKSRSLLVSLQGSPSEVEESRESVKLKLLNLCNQDSVADFADVYDWKKCKIKKIGEGTYGEVYMIKKAQKGQSSCVLKVIPVSENDNDDTCEGLSNVLSEVKITKCLSELRKNKRNNTKNFIKVNRVFVTTGIYPPELIVAWDHFSETKTSYNARPDSYKESKLFVLLELEYGGIDLSSCVLRNALEAECVLKQVATALAVAEEQFAFEHRDLHLGNILIKRTTKKKFTYKLRGKDISFECHGVEATLIDFTLSRLYEEGYIYYNDLAEDSSLFNQTGDYQFKVYKDMKNVVGNQWQEACFYSNVLWLKYLCQKFKEFEYSRPSTKAHKRGLKAIDKFSEQLTSCNCAVECLSACGITPIYFERSDADSELTKKSILISRNSIQKSKLSLCH